MTPALRAHVTALPVLLSRPAALGLPDGLSILAAHFDARTYTLLLTDGTLTQLATGRLTPAGAGRVTLTPPLLEADGLAHGRIPAAFLTQLPDQGDDARQLAALLHAAARAQLPPLEHQLRHALRRHDPHAPLRAHRDRARRRAQAHADLQCGQLTLHGRTHRVTVTDGGLLLDDGRVLSEDVLDTL